MDRSFCDNSSSLCMINLLYPGTFRRANHIANAWNEEQQSKSVIAIIKENHRLIVFFIIYLLIPSHNQQLL